MELKKIIDVGEFQGLIDWEKVKPHIDGAILRCGYGMDQAAQDEIAVWHKNRIQRLLCSGKHCC